MHHAFAALSLPLLFAACGGRVVLGDSPVEGLQNLGDDAGGQDASNPGDGSPDASRGACSLVGGTWNVAYNSFYGTNASFQFSSDGTFLGGALDAALPAGEIYSGQWALNADAGAGTYGDVGVSSTEISFWNTTGMQCTSSYETNMSLSYDADCATATFVVLTDACTGSRKFFDSTTILTRQ